ncbi:Lsr2 family protein [Tessaracoccus lubricantis]|uniref:Lsr2 family protein n=1 Tax=Tessaracoccus lubricantis TaxID=545543 RepID=A0ABP9F1U4_9ACTN
MARLVRVVHIDDFDGSEGAQPVEFSIGGDAYTIDLTRENEEALRELLAPYIAKADKVARRRNTSGRGAARKVSNTDVRDWARANGYKVSDRGRISAEIVAAYEAAN